jgi:hypothetical protein
MSNETSGASSSAAPGGYAGRTKAERLRDLADTMEREFRQPIYNDDEVWVMMQATLLIMDLADEAEGAA